MDWVRRVDVTVSPHREFGLAKQVSNPTLSVRSTQARSAIGSTQVVLCVGTTYLGACVYRDTSRTPRRALQGCRGSPHYGSGGRIAMRRSRWPSDHVLSVLPTSFSSGREWRPQQQHTVRGRTHNRWWTKSAMAETAESSAASDGHDGLARLSTP